MGFGFFEEFFFVGCFFNIFNMAKIGNLVVVCFGFVFEFYGCLFFVLKGFDFRNIVIFLKCGFRGG